MLHDDYFCLMESGKQQIKEVRSKVQAKNLDTKATSKLVWNVVRIAPPPLSRDMKIKIKKSIKQQSCEHFKR